MFNKNDIYSHIANGGDPKELRKALENEITAAQDKLIKEKDKKLKEQAHAQNLAVARVELIAALKKYLPLVNCNISDKSINNFLDSLEYSEKSGLDISWLFKLL